MAADDEQWVVLGDELAAELRSVTLEEFRLAEARYETDTRLGRELLFLVSNTEWLRRTTEVVDVSRVSAAETRLTVDVDTSYIAHEALRTIDGPLWLPLFTLPSTVPDTDLPAGTPVPPAEPPIGVDITDAHGVRVAGVPQAEVRRHLAAALAETVVARLARRSAGPVEGTADQGRYGREHQVLLAAMLAQLLTRPPADPAAAGSAGDPAAQDAPVDHGTRLGRARNDLQQWLDGDRELLRHGRRGPRSVLASREAEVVQALRGSTFVVVPVAYGPPTSFTMVMPTRALARSSRWDAVSAVRLRLAILAPTTHSDRVVEVLLPDGVRLADDRQAPRADAVVAVAVPPQFEQLRALLRWILDPDTAAWPRKQLAELAGTKLEAVVQCLAHHYDSFDADGRPATDALLADLLDLRDPLERLATLSVAGPSTTPEDDPDRWAAVLAGMWPPAGRQLGATTLRRRIDRSTTSPGSVRFRASAIEEFTLRAQPTRAYLDVVLESRESPVLGTARAVNKINVLVLAGVAGMLLTIPLGDNGSRSEVLAALLTFFPAIQASRLRQPDATTLGGLLTMRHFTAGLATAVPGLLLAGVLAFEPDGPVTKIAAVLAVAAQVACHLWILDLRRSLPLLGRRNGPVARAFHWRRRILTLRTLRSPDHRRFDVLLTAWCRSLTGDVLLVGRTAHPYVVVEDAPGSFAALLSGSQGRLADLPAAGRGPDLLRRATEARRALAARLDSAGPAAEDGVAHRPVNLVGALRSTAVDRSATFLIFRDPPRQDWVTATTDGTRSITPLDLDRGQLAPMEPPDWVLDVMVGATGEQAGAAVLDHPLATVAGAAAAAGFTLLNVQLPAPPLQGLDRRVWLRVRVGVPYRQGDSLRRLWAFLDALEALRSAGVRVHLREVPPTESIDATQTAPEDPFDPPPEWRVAAAAPGSAGEPVTDRDLLVEQRDDERWRLVAVCGGPHSGLLIAVLTALAENGRVTSLGAVTSGVLNGTLVVFLLGRTDDLEPADPERLGRHLESHPLLRDRPATMTVLAGVPHGLPPLTPPRALLKVQIHTPDRPGVLQDLLGALGRQIGRERERRAVELLPPGNGAAPADGPDPDVDVLYTLTPVVDGQAISGRMLVRLPQHPDGVGGWDAVRWTEVGRRVAQAVARSAAAGGAAPSDAERTVRRSDDTVVTLDLVRRPPSE